jgi:hypothetical protein
MMSYAHCRQSFFENLSEQSARPNAVEDEYYSCHRRSKWKNTKKSCKEHGETCR